MKPQFKIESVTGDGPHAYVRATIVEAKHFSVSKGSVLGEARLLSELKQIDEQTYIFTLECVVDLSKFSVGSVVQLTE